MTAAKTPNPQSAIPNPQSENPQLLEALLRDTQDAYANLLALIESSLQRAADEHLAEEDVFAKPIADGMSQADIRLGILREHLEPWSRRRRNYPPELVQRVDDFLDLLKKGLLGLQAQLAHRTREVEKLLAETQDALQKLSSQRAGFQGYRQTGKKSKMLDKKA